MLVELEDTLSFKVLGCAIEVHKELGPGLLESIYEEALAMELEDNGFCVQRQQPVPVMYKGRTLKNDLRYDLLVNGRLLVELKSVENLLPVHSKQTLSYLKLMHLREGLLINFNVNVLKEGVRRILNDKK